MKVNFPQKWSHGVEIGALNGHPRDRKTGAYRSRSAVERLVGGELLPGVDLLVVGEPGFGLMA